MKAVAHKMRELLKLEKISISENAIVVVTGTGISSDICDIEIQYTFYYNSLFANESKKINSDKLIIGKNKLGVTVFIVTKRLFYYEGYNNTEAVSVIELMYHLGAKYLILTGPVGGLNKLYKKGDFVIIDDYINLLGKSPIIDHPLLIEEKLVQFPDMSEPYDGELMSKLVTICESNPYLRKKVHYFGTYAAMLGPQLETRAEYSMLIQMGADVVGMSTVPETIFGKWIGMKVACVALISDLCNPESLEVLTLDDVLEIINDSQNDYKTIISTLVNQIKSENS
jgi:purine-nucleoside phosphorylase